MADVSKVLKPRRGLKSTMASSAKKGTVLASGELFVEAPDTGVGTGQHKIKIGDGTTAYNSLPYAIGDTSNDKIEFSSNTATTVANALNSVASGQSLKTIIGGLKQAISLCNTSITQLNDDTSKINVYVGDDGKLHFVDSEGADSALPFNPTTESEIEIIPLVPTLTSNNGSDGGTASASSIFGSGADAYYAFNQSLGNWAASGTTSTNSWIQYKFITPVVVNKIDIQPDYDSNLKQCRAKDFIVQCSNDGSTYYDLFTGSCTNNYTIQTFNFENTKAYLYYRLYIKNSYTSSVSIGIRNLQFYGYKLEALIPTLTSNTGSNGVASASSSYSPMAPYGAFGGGWMEASQSSSTGAWVQYKFNGPVNVNLIKCKINMSSTTTTKNTNISAKVQYSLDGTTWIDIENSETSFYVGESAGIGDMNIDCSLSNIIAIRVVNTYKGCQCRFSVSGFQCYRNAQIDYSLDFSKYKYIKTVGNGGSYTITEKGIYLLTYGCGSGSQGTPPTTTGNIIHNDTKAYGNYNGSYCNKFMFVDCEVGDTITHSSGTIYSSHIIRLC